MRLLSKAATISLVFIFLTFTVAVQASNQAFAQKESNRKGSVAGTVVDSETGETLIGVNIIIQGTSTGTTTDLDGRYALQALDVGVYDLSFSYIGYQTTIVRGIEVRPGETTLVDLRLTPELLQMGDVVVEARAIENSDAILLRSRQKAAALSDAISAEAIARSGSSTAADAMKKVTGASVVDGKYVYIRGLGDRYVSTQLNGAVLPSADPDRNSVPLDIFPANLLDNVVTAKTFTPDQPGSFSGGSINIGTKTFPEALNLHFSTSLSASSNVGPGGDFLSYSGGEAGWLGTNGGTHKLPEQLADPAAEIPSRGVAYTDAEAAQKLDEISRSFKGVMAPSRLPAPLSQSYSFSAGNQMAVLGRPLGVIAGLSYSRSASGYDGGTTARYQLTGNVAETNELNNDFLFTDSRGIDEVLWGGLVNLAYKPHPNHELGINYIRNQGGESVARYQSGSFPRDLVSTATYETRTLRYTERHLSSLQARGEHALRERGLRLEWNATASNTLQDEPDLRFFTNNYTLLERDGRVDTVYAIRPDIYSVPTRYFRRMDEESRAANAAVTVPFRQWRGLSAQLKVGGSYSTRDRSFRERRFEFRQDKLKYTGDPFGFFSETNMGILESAGTDRFFRFGNYVVDATQASSNYDGSQRIGAGFVMIDIPLTRHLRAVGGLRLETTNMTAVSHDTSLAGGSIDTRDFLPSMNVIYGVRENMNLRMAYGRTLARPTFREIAPYASFSFVGDYIFVGNPNLKRSLIDNYDLRWEWFVRPGEIFALSGFYKHFRNPIERALNPIAANPEVQFRNVEKARLIGLELEARKRLDLIGLERFQVGANISLVRSQVAIAPDELAAIRALEPDASSSRQLQGQSPFTVNVDMTYDNPNKGTTVSTYYNVFGARLDRVAIGGTPDVYEQPFHLLDVTVKQRLFFGFALKGSVKNLLNQVQEFGHTYKDELYVSEAYGYGRSYSLGVSYNVE